MRGNCRTIYNVAWLAFAAFIASSFSAYPISAAANDPIQTPTLDCSATSVAGAPAEVYRGIYGMCPREPLKPFATPCFSPFQFNKCSTLVDCTADENGVPRWSVQNAAGAAGRTPNATGAGSGTPIAATRLMGDDPDATTGDGTGRQGAFPSLMVKGQDMCRWWAEAMHHTSSTLSAAARCPNTPEANCKEGEAPRLAFATADIVCRSQDTAQPNPRALASTYDGTTCQPGTMAAASAVRNSVNPDTARPCSGFDNPTDPANPTLVSAFSFRAPDWSGGGTEGQNVHYDRGTNNPVRMAADVLTPQTFAYDVYDPSRKSVEDERKLALDLASKTPQEVAAIRAEKSGWLDAHASGGAGSLVGIMCRLQPNSCQFSSHFDRGGVILESYYAGMARDNAISTPNIEFLPDLAEQFPDLMNQVKAMGGNLVENMFANVLKPATNATLTANQIVKCLNAMRTPAIKGNPAEIINLANSINANCPVQLSGCLQSQGGFSGAALNSCFLNINASSLSNSAEHRTNGMSDVAHFIFNGNPRATINGLTPSNLASLAGADVPLVNDLLMQRIPNMPQIGDLLGNTGQFFGNLGAMPRTLLDFKRNPYIQSFFGEHPFDIRAMMNTLPERDLYSPCTGDRICYTSTTLAPMVIRRPWYKGDASGGSTYSAPASETPEGTPKNDSPDCLGANCSDAAIGEPPREIDSQLLPPNERSALNAFGVFTRNTKSTAPIFEVVEQLKNELAANKIDPNSLDNPNNPNSPLHFGPKPTHAAIGMPETNLETGALLFRKDGTTYYARKPDEKVNFIAKDLYTIEDVEKGYLPKEFANFVPKNHLEPWDRLAMIITENGGYDFLPPERLEAVAARVNKAMEDIGSKGFMTAALLRQGAANFLKEIETMPTYVEDAPPSIAQQKVASILTHFGLPSAMASAPMTQASFISPAYGASLSPKKPSKFRDVVRCAGGKNSNQIRVDILAHRAARYNSHILQRNEYNLMIEEDDAAGASRCKGGACAPKPCPGHISAKDPKCWARTHNPWYPGLCTFPAIKVGPSDEYPIASVRYDQKGKEDIGHYRRINNICGKLPSPVGEVVKGSCHFYDQLCNQTMAYNCRTFPNGKRFCGYTWTYHPLIKYRLDALVDAIKLEFAAYAGERHMDAECETLRAPVPLVNKHMLSSMVSADEAGVQLASGTAYPATFGVRMPYIMNDSTGTAFGQRAGQPQNPNDTSGAYVFINPSSTYAAELAQMAKLSPLPNPPQNAVASLLHRFAPQAFAAPPSAAGHSQSAMPCVGGAAGANIPNCPSFNGVDPQSDMLTSNLLQAHTVRDYGFNCQPHERFAWLKSGMAMYTEMCGASIPVSISRDGKPTGQQRNIIMPQPARQNENHPEGWNGTGGAPMMTEQTGVEAAFALGDRAGCSIIQFPNGMGEGMPTLDGSSRVSPPVFGVITEVNRARGYIDAFVTGGGGMLNSYMQTAHSERFRRRFYLPGSMPQREVDNFRATYGFEPYCYMVRPEQSSSCIMTQEDVQMRAIIFSRPE